MGFNSLMLKNTIEYRLISNDYSASSSLSPIITLLDIYESLVSFFFFFL